MKITKLGHCCLAIETKGKKIVTDPGAYSIEAHSKLENVDFVLFTHEHADHYHLDSLRVILQKNPKAAVYANSSVSALLEKAGVAHTLVNDGDDMIIGGVELAGIGTEHALMHKSIPISSNMGFFIEKRLWYPGDAFTDPKRPIDILALPVSGPWMKISEAIDYAIALKPKVAFPVHDHIRFGSAHMFPGKILPENGIAFEPMVEGDSKEF